SADGRREWASKSWPERAAAPGAAPLRLLPGGPPAREPGARAGAARPAPPAGGRGSTAGARGGALPHAAVAGLCRQRRQPDPPRGAPDGRAERGAAAPGNGGDVPGPDRGRWGAAVPLHGAAAAAGAAEGPDPARLPGPVPPPAAVAVLPGVGEVPAAVRLRAVAVRRGRRRGGRGQPG